MAKKQSPEQAKLALYEALVANVLPDFDLDKAVEANDFTMSLDGETILYRPQTAASEATAPASAESDESSTSEAQTEPAGDHDGKEQTQASEAAASAPSAAPAQPTSDTRAGVQALANVSSILSGRKQGSAPTAKREQEKPDTDKMSDDEFDAYLLTQADRAATA